MHSVLRAAGVTARLYVWDWQPHGNYLEGLNQDLPESEEAAHELNEYFDRHLK